MRVERVRPKWSDEELATIYSEPHDHRLYGRGHSERVTRMSQMAHALGPVETGADLSCGNGVVLDAVEVTGHRYFGDYAAGYEFTGPIETTIDQIPNVDLFVCGETIEHLDDPPAVLKQIREKSKFLVLSTPLEAWGDSNSQHYWAWDCAAVSSMLIDAGWDHMIEYDEVDSREYGEPYLYGVWSLR